MNPSHELFEVSDTYWLMVFALSLCVSIGYVLRLASSKTNRFEPLHRLAAFVAALVLCLIAVGGLNLVHRELDPRYRLTGTVAVFGVTAWLTWLHLKHAKTPHELFRRRPSAWLLLASSVVLTAWSSHLFHEQLSPPSKRPLVMVFTPGARSQVHEFVALTDRNHPIKVYRLDENPAEHVFATDVIDGSALEFTGSMIQRGSANPLANCHGWVFLDSQYLMTPEGVQRVLDDNGYEVVSEPSGGDVIIYRNDNREIVHSGIVRGVLNDGTIIVESKWGTEGLFLHNPEDQPYSQTFEYYRTSRRDHHVKIVPVDELPADELPVDE